jgi:hypothetical protein
MSISRLSASFMIASTLVSVTGCGPNDGLQRVRVHGRVTYQGQPVMDGQIRFSPDPGTEGPLSIAKIIDGEYAHDAQGGVPAGTHQIRFLAWDHKLPIPQGPTDPERPQLLPAKYNTESELTITIEAQGGWLEKNFELE